MRIGFIGGWGHHYLAEIVRERPGDVEAFAFAGDGVDDARAKDRFDNLAASHKGGQWFDSAAALLDEFKPDVMNIGPVYGRIGDFVIQTLRRQIPCVSEKPLANDWPTLVAIRAAAKESSAPLVTEFPFRSDPAMAAAQQAVAAGELGDIVLATGQKSYRFGSRPAWYSDRQLYTGTIPWVASHAIDFIRFVTGQRFVETFGRQGNVSHPEMGVMEDHTVSMFTLAGGGAAVVHADYGRPNKAATHGDDRLRVVGSKGLVEVRDGRCLLTTHDQAESDITDRLPARSAAEDMLAAAMGKTDDDRYGTLASLESAALILFARDAADTGMSVEIPGDI